MPVSRSRPQSAVPLAPLLILFLLSGASALIYQVLWMRLLALVFGVTVHAASTVLAAFMAGLAFGSVAAGRFADRIRRPLRAFAAAEGLVAVAALATPFLLAGIETVYVELHPLLGIVPGLVSVTRFVLAFVVLIIPTTLMGATLPLVVKASLGGGTILGRQVSLLYGLNTGGAIAGALAAGIWLVPQLGITSTFRIGAVVNLTVAVIALAVSIAYERHATEPAVPETAEHEAPESTVTPALSATVRRLLLLTFAVSGFVSFALEIVWFRMLILILRPTTYSFTIMLATVLAGIAFGSALSAPVARWRRGTLLAVLAVLEVLIALAAVGSMAVIGQAAAVNAWSEPFFSGSGQLEYFGPMAVTSVAAILPVALLLGVAFPIGIALWASDVGNARAGERVGAIYAVNVAGAVAGALLTGFVLLPVLGSRATLVLVSALALGTGLLLLSQLPRRIAGFTTSVAAVVAFAALALTTRDPVISLLAARYPRETPVWRQDDGHATVTILQRNSRFANHPLNLLYINGMHQASDDPGMVAYHRLIGTLPLAVNPEARHALVIGVGGGATAGAVGAFSRQLDVDVVELSPAVVAAARQFSSVNHDLLQLPHVKVHVDDGRNHMLVTSQKYDVITADVILPIHAGAGNLYSAEYYRLMRRVLNNRGVALQWIGSGSETEYKLIMRTFLSVFPHTTLWEGGSLLVGAKRPLVLDQQAFERRLHEPDARQALESMGLGSFPALLSRYVAGPGELRTFVGDGPILTDDRPLTEYFLSLPQNDHPVDLSQVRGDVARHVITARAE